MARRKSGIGMRKPRKIGTEELKRQKYMSRANSGLMNSPRFGFSSTKNGKVDVCVFYAKFAAKKFLDLMIQEDEVTWIDDNTLRTNCDVIIKGEQLGKISNHKVTFDEDRYHTFDETLEHRALVIRSDDFRKEFVQGESVSTRSRTSRKGMVLMKTIAAELGMTPRVARGILRDTIKKPDHGWAWRTSEDIERIKNILLGKNTTIIVDFSKAEE